MQKHNTIKLIAVFIFSIVLSYNGIAQQKNKIDLSYSAYLGGTCPIGTFGKVGINTNTDKMWYHTSNWVISNNGGMKGAAKLGGELGFKVTMPFESVGIHIGQSETMPLAHLGAFGKVLSSLKFNFVGGIDVFYNGVRSNVEEDLFSVFISHNVRYLPYANMPEGARLEFTPDYQLFYINIPIMLGANAIYKYNQDIDFWTELELGVNLTKLSNVNDFEYNAQWNRLLASGTNNISTYSTTKGSIDFDLKATFAWQIGLGMTWQKKYSVGLHYYYLGRSTIEGTVNYELDNPYEYELDDFLKDSKYVKEEKAFSSQQKLLQNLLVLRLGYNF